MNLPNSSIYAALRAKLLQDDTGSNNLLLLLGHFSYDNRIGRDAPEGQAKDPYLSYKIMSSVTEAIHSLNRVLIRVSAHSKREETSIQIGDRVQWLLQVPTGDNRAFFNFSNEVITVKIACWKSRVQAKYEKETKIWTDSNLLEAVIDTQNPCGE